MKIFAGGSMLAIPVKATDSATSTTKRVFNAAKLRAGAGQRGAVRVLPKLHFGKTKEYFTEQN
jgi:hypothetical protein